MYTKIKDKMFDNPLVFDNIRRVLLGGYRHMFKQVLRAANFKEGETVLDIGCGTGVFSKLFKSGYTGVDAAQGFIEFARNKYPQHKFLVKTAQEIDFSDNSFDKIMLLNFIHFLKDEDAKELLKKCSVIAKDSVCIMEPLPSNRFWTKFFYSQNRGHNIKSLFQLKEEISESLEIVDVKVFRSGFYKLVIVKCVPK
tara:strand:+ start:952 stop:1539 length:588 start_codon:yes stop_codon:yes gene_type:complete